MLQILKNATQDEKDIYTPVMCTTGGNKYTITKKRQEEITLLLVVITQVTL